MCICISTKSLISCCVKSYFFIICLCVGQHFNDIHRLCLTPSPSGGQASDLGLRQSLLLLGQTAQTRQRQRSQVWKIRIQWMKVLWTNKYDPTSEHLHLHSLGNAPTVLLIIEPNPMDKNWRGRKEGDKESAEHRMSFMMTDKWKISS